MVTNFIGIWTLYFTRDKRTQSYCTQKSFNSNNHRKFDVATEVGGNSQTFEIDLDNKTAFAKFELFNLLI